jgi:hypothetical protein
MGILPRIDAWFELHVNLLWPEYKSYGEPYIRWLREQRFPVVCWDQRYLANAVIFPRRELVHRFGPFFFSSTFAWMMAYAINVGVEELGLFGVDMSSKDEYIQQRPGGHYFIQRAQEAGIKVVIPDESDLMQPPPLYGYCEVTPYARKMAAREKEVRDRIAQTEPQASQFQQQTIYLRGALENMEYMRQVWGGAADQSYFAVADPVLNLPQVPPPVVTAAPSIVPDLPKRRRGRPRKKSEPAVESKPTAPPSMVDDNVGAVREL